VSKQRRNNLVNGMVPLVGSDGAEFFAVGVRRSAVKDLGIIGVFEVAVDDTLSVSVETRSERMSVVEIQPAPGARRSATIPPT